MEARTLVGNVPYARFGYAMANLGDINGDGLHGERMMVVTLVTVFDSVNMEMCFSSTLPHI